MNILLLILPVTLFLGAVFAVSFLWAARKGQFDDLTTPAFEVLRNEEEVQQGERRR